MTARAVPALAEECRTRCAYGTCRDAGRNGGPYGCGGCCGCLGGCQVAYESTQPLADVEPDPGRDPDVSADLAAFDAVITDQPPASRTDRSQP